MPDDVRILIVDDHIFLRDIAAEKLDSTPGLAVVERACDAQEAIGKAMECKPDIILMDIDMPGMICFEAASRIQAQLDDVRIIFLSAYFNDHYIEQALKVKAGGYITKNEPPETIIHAIRTVANGSVYFSPEVYDRIVVDSHGARMEHGHKSRASTLTPREVEILRYLARGMSKKEIAATIHISINTVDVHTKKIMSKLKIHDRVELARFAIREGLAEA